MTKSLLTLLFLAFSLGNLLAQTDSFRNECPANSYPQELSGSDYLQTKLILEKRMEALGLKVLWKVRGAFMPGQGRAFTDTPEDLKRLKSLTQILLVALEKYPSDFFSRIDLQNIVVVKDLKVGNQLRKAMPHPLSRSLFYADNNDLECLAGLEERVHHELYHFVEARINGSMFYQDTLWRRMNPEYFKYGHGGSSVYNQAVAFQNLGHPEEGFVSTYAKTALEEDKAEVFGWMMTKGYADRLLEWTQSDSILAKKAFYLKSFMEGLGLKISDPYRE
jgi:hypothetical protein